MPWIPSHQELASHPKLLRLAAALGLNRPQAIGHLHLLWWWALNYAKDGDLAAFSNAEVALAAEYEGDAEKFIGAMVAAGFIDEEPDSVSGVLRHRLHDWQDYGGKWVKRRATDAERMRRRRKGQSGGDDVERLSAEAQEPTEADSGAGDANEAGVAGAIQRVHPFAGD